MTLAHQDIKPEGGWWHAIHAGDWASTADEVTQVRASLADRVRKRMVEAQCTEMRNLHIERDIKTRRDDGAWFLEAVAEIR